MSQSVLLTRIKECQALREQSFGQEKTRYGYELLGLQVAGLYQEPLSDEHRETLAVAYRTAYDRGVEDGATLLKVDKLKETL
jgi:hypothetical protein